MMSGKRDIVRIAVFVLSVAGTGVLLAAPQKRGIFSGPVNEFRVIRNALRDTMWDVAEQQAKRAEKNNAQRHDARMAQLEAFAGKEDWEAVRKNAAEWGKSAPNEAYRYWHAYALWRLGRADDAERILDGGNFTDAVYVVFVLRLKARMESAKGNRAEASVYLKRAAQMAESQASKNEILMEHARILAEDGDAAGALDVLEKGGALRSKDEGGDEARLYSAQLKTALGDTAGAEKTLRALVSDKAKTSDRKSVV